MYDLLRTSEYNEKEKFIRYSSKVSGPIMRNLIISIAGYELDTLTAWPSAALRGAKISLHLRVRKMLIFNNLI